MIVSRVGVPQLPADFLAPLSVWMCKKWKLFVWFAPFVVDLVTTISVLRVSSPDAAIPESVKTLMF